MAPWHANSFGKTRNNPERLSWGGSIPPPGTQTLILIIMATQKKKKAPSHALFWSLIKETLGYEEAYKDVIKEGLVNQYSGGKTCSLSEMYKKYTTEYSNMLEAMKGNTEQRRVRYDEDRDKAAKRVIAAISSWLDKLGYKYPTPTDKIRYAMAVACRAANCGNFNAIPESRLSAIYSLYCKKNSIETEGNPALDYVISKN